MHVCVSVGIFISMEDKQNCPNRDIFSFLLMLIQTYIGDFIYNTSSFSESRIQ